MDVRTRREPSLQPETQSGTARACWSQQDLAQEGRNCWASGFDRDSEVGVWCNGVFQRCKTSKEHFFYKDSAHTIMKAECPRGLSSELETQGSCYCILASIPNSKNHGAKTVSLRLT